MSGGNGGSVFPVPSQPSKDDCPQSLNFKMLFAWWGWVVVPKGAIEAKRARDSDGVIG